MNVNQKKLLRTLLAELHKRNVLCSVEVALRDYYTEWKARGSM